MIALYTPYSFVFVVGLVPKNLHGGEARSSFLAWQEEMRENSHEKSPSTSSQSSIRVNCTVRTWKGNNDTEHDTNSSETYWKAGKRSKQADPANI